MLNSILNGDWSNSVPGRKIPEGAEADSAWLATTTQFVRSFENPVPGPQPIYATMTFDILSVYFSPISDSQPHAVGRALYRQAVSLTLFNTYNSFLALSPSPHITASAQLSSSSTFVRASSSINGPFLHCYLHALASTPVLLLEAWNNNTCWGMEIINAQTTNV